MVLERSHDEAVARLCALNGVGEWTAPYIAMRQLREPDAFPVGDVGLLRALADADGRRPTAAELLARAECWRPWRARRGAPVGGPHARASPSADAEAADGYRVA